MRCFLVSFFSLVSAALAVPEVFVATGDTSRTEPTTTRAVVVSVELSESSETPVTVEYTTEPGTAGAADFTSTSGTLIFAPSELQKTVSISISGDALFEESSESFTFVLSAPVGATLGRAQTTLSIIDDDILEISASDSTIARSVSGEAGALDFLVTHTAVDHSSPLSLGYQITGLSAIAGTDLTNRTGTRTLQNGSTSFSITIPVPGAPQIGDRTVLLSLSAPPALLERVRFQGLPSYGRIQGNTVAPILSVSADGATPEGGGNAISFIVALSEAQPGDVAVDYATRDGSAIAGSDYTAASGSLVFAAGETEKTVVVPVIDDTAFEGDETVLLDLTPAATGSVTSAEKWVAPEIFTLPGFGFEEVSDSALDGDMLVASTTEQQGSYSVSLVQNIPGSGWRLLKNVTPPAWFRGDNAFGASVALSGDTLAIGAPALVRSGQVFPQPRGAVVLFERNAGGANEWGQTAIIYPAETPEQTAEPFGSILALHGDTLGVGLSENGRGGKDRVQIFCRSAQDGAGVSTKSLSEIPPRRSSAPRLISSEIRSRSAPPTKMEVLEPSSSTPAT